MEEGLQGLLMGAVLVMFLIAMESALQVVDSSEALEQTVEERMMEQRTITVQRISEKESAEQMYLLTVNTEFVDSICNTGFLTMEMYQQFYKEISAASGIYEVHMYREQKDIVLEQGDYSYESIFFDEKDMLAELEKNRVYEFERGDYLKVAIIKKKGWMDFVGSRDSSVNVLYGGTVRYEDF